MIISLPNAHMREKKKTMIRKRSLIKAIKNILIKNSVVKLMSVKNGTQVMRVPNQKVMTWQP
jgi:phage pi2 protein 07